MMMMMMMKEPTEQEREVLSTAGVSGSLVRRAATKVLNLLDAALTREEGIAAEIAELRARAEKAEWESKEYAAESQRRGNSLRRAESEAAEAAAKASARDASRAAEAASLRAEWEQLGIDYEKAVAEDSTAWGQVHTLTAEVTNLKLGLDTVQEAHHTEIARLNAAVNLQAFAATSAAEHHVETSAEVARLKADNAALLIDYKARVDECDNNEREIASLRKEVERRKAELESFRTEIAGMCHIQPERAKALAHAERQLATVQALIKERKHPRFGPGYGGIYVKELERILEGQPAAPCLIPPDGWACSRGEGHQGPCAASQVEHRDSPLTPDEEHLVNAAWEQYHKPAAQTRTEHDCDSPDCGTSIANPAGFGVVRREPKDSKNEKRRSDD